MRVLCVGNMYPPHHLGGYELIWRSAIRELRRRGHVARVLTSDYARQSPEGIEDPDVHRELRWYWRDHEFPWLTPRQRLQLERHNAAVLARHLDALRPDAVSWWAMGGMSLSLIERVRRSGLPAVGFVIDDWMVYGPKADQWMRMFAASRWLEAAGASLTGMPTSLELARAARWLFVSQTTRRRALEAVGELADTAVLPAGIDATLIDPRPREQWAWRLLYFGRIDERKGIDTAIDALAHLPTESRLTVIGDGDERQATALRQRARAQGVENRVSFEPARPREGLTSAIAACDAVVFPVRWEEPWGLVPLEAMAQGRPVCATGRGGSGEYLHDGQNCMRFVAGDAAGLAACVRRLAADPDLCHRLVAGGLETARRYTETTFNEGVVQELERASRGGVSGPASR